MNFLLKIVKHPAFVNRPTSHYLTANNDVQCNPIDDLTGHSPLSKTNWLGSISPAAEPYHDLVGSGSCVNHFRSAAKNEVLHAHFGNRQRCEVFMSLST